MAVTNPDPDKEGSLSENVVRGIEGILTVAMIIAGFSTLYISAYFTVSVMVVLGIVLLTFLVKMDSNKTKRYAERLTYERELQLQQTTMAMARTNLDAIQYQQAVKMGKLTLTAQLIIEFKRLADDTILPTKDREAYTLGTKKLEELTRLVQTGLS